MLEETLRQADEKAQQERLQRLQQQGDEHLPPPSVSEGVPFVQDSSNYDFMDVDTSTEWKDVSGDVESAAAQVTNQEEESYRLKALDYALGHVAAKVKDVSSTSTKSSSTNDNDKSNKAGSLLQAMLRSAQSAHISSSSDVAVDETKDVVMTNAAKGDLRSQEAQDEFEQFAKKAGSKQKQKQKQKHAGSDAVDSDDDEEETTTVLESEFQSVVPEPNSVRSKKMAQSNGPPKAMDNDDDDIDDLAMAIKSKKKKKSKKSKN
jgi:hypothetical protein